MKNLKTSVLLSALVFLSMSYSFYSCGNKEIKKSSQENTEAVKDTVPLDTTQMVNGKMAEEVQLRVKEIYDYLCEIYNASDEEMPDGQGIESRFCSESWKAESNAVSQINKKRPGEIGLWDYDYWIQGQDWEKVSYKDIKVIGVTDEKTAHVLLTLHNMEDHQIGLTLVKENGNWLIDDLKDDSNPNGIRKTQAKYLENNQ